MLLMVLDLQWTFFLKFDPKKSHADPKNFGPSQTKGGAVAPFAPPMARACQPDPLLPPNIG